MKVNGRVKRQLNALCVCVWGGIFNGWLIGPYFFNGTINSSNHLKVLREVLIELENSPQFVQLQPIKENRFGNKINLSTFSDGAPAHYETIVRDVLNENLDECIGRRVTNKWPSRPSYLNPMD